MGFSEPGLSPSVARLSFVGGPGSGRRAGTALPPACGTLSAVRRHERLHEKLDEACLQARRVKDRARKSAPCACGCGERVQTSRSSRPVGEAMRNECRKRVGRPNVPRTPQTPGEWRRCRVCDERFLRVYRQIYCSWTCERMGAELRDGRGAGVLRWQLATPAEREAMLAAVVAYRRSPKAELRAVRYGSEHVAERRRRLDERGPGARCARCNGLLGGDESLIDLDHDDDDPARYLGLSHSLCNRGRRPVVAELLAG